MWVDTIWQTKIHRHQLEWHITLRLLLPILLPVVQRLDIDCGVFRISPIHSLGVVANAVARTNA